MTKSLIAPLLIWFLAIWGSPLAGAESTKPNPKSAEIRELLELTGSGKLGIQVMHQMISAMKQANPDVPDEFWVRFASKIDANEVIEMVLPIYEKHFSAEEVRQITAFYKTSAGKKLISKMPLIMSEGMEAGQKWGMKIGQLAAEEIQAEKTKK